MVAGKLRAAVLADDIEQMSDAVEAARLSLIFETQEKKVSRALACLRAYAAEGNNIAAYAVAEWEHNLAAPRVCAYPSIYPWRRM